MRSIDQILVLVLHLVFSVASAFLDCHFLNPFLFFENGVGVPEVDLGRSNVN